MKQKGFTLIELLVVVAIIGILAAVGVVAYSGYTKGAKLKTAQQNLRTISKWLAAESTKVCSAYQGNYNNGMYLNNDSSNFRYFIKCSDDGTALAYAASHFFYNNGDFKNPYNGNNAIASKAPTSRRTLSTFIFADNAAFAAMLTIANDDKTSNATVNIPS